ncbi:MAG TPA: 1,4-alpha-glucan branching protein GlgB [Enhygromyxa sp.]|nr:1,4-alpha-glucan branching protein GlgB [Enhygromyxa sp.]
MGNAGLTAVEIDALARAAHGDPFAVLGPHASAEGIWLRVLVPDARSVSVLVGDERLATLDAIHPVGLFAKLFEPDSLPHDYRLEIEDPQDTRTIEEDPYRFGPSLGAIDRYLLAEGTHLRPWQVLGAHVCEQDGAAGVRFAVWAPNASRVAVIGDFNDWHELRHPMRFHPGAGVWELFIPNVPLGAVYKYAVRARDGVALPHKADPYAFASELRPATASVITVEPQTAPRSRAIDNSPSAPISIYEVHLGSWRRTTDNQFLDWSTLAELLPAYVAGLGFTHIELLPIAEHPFDGSWGYQVTGMYAPTSRFGDPRGFADFVAACHAHKLGVILDWVPAHFPNDTHALAQFDGTALYEYADPREGLHKDWNTLIFNFARTEVRNYLVGNALYWLETWGLDGLRVDAVASMLYRDYSRQDGEWIPNVEGGRENLEAVALIQRMNEVVDAELPEAITVAEESTSWPGVTRPVEDGGLGFHFKWNLGWMHDTLRYMGIDPIYRKHHHEALTFGIMYAFDEQFVLALSHDEVVHGKRSLLGKMSGDRWQQFANLRAYFGFMWGHPGKKLLFMGGELAQEREWNHDRALDWALLEAPEHRGIQTLIADLNRFYRAHPALYELDGSEQGFEWIVTDDRDHSIIAFVRKSSDGARVLVVCNFTPVPRHGYRVGMDEAGAWIERLNTDDPKYGGSGVGNGSAAIESEEIPSDGRPHSLALHLPPLGTVMLEPLLNPACGGSCPE